MKKVLLSTVAVAAILLSGCSKKTPEVDLTKTSPETLAAQIQDASQSVLFDFNKYNIRADQHAVIKSNVSLFNEPAARTFSIKVEGNCDEWGTDEYNYALGLKRATAVKNALIKEGVDANRISVVSYGESNPVCKDKTKDCDAQNRRDDFKVSVN